LPVLLLSLAAMLPSLSIGLLSDDFSWMLLAQNNGNTGLLSYLSQPAPFGYFRPLPLLFFRLCWLAFKANLWIYRLAPLLLHIGTTLIIFRVLLLLEYSDKISFISALIFSIMPCHAEALFWLCAINELFSAFFIMAGIYILLGFKGWQSTIVSSFFFLLALFSRESAFCFVPLLALLKIKGIRVRLRKLALVTVSVSGIYILAHRLWKAGLPFSHVAPSPGHLDLNIVRIFSRLAQYLLKVLLPIKTLMEFSRFKLYHALRNIYASPDQNLLLYWILTISVVLVFIFVIWLLMKFQGRKMVFGLSFFSLALIIYLPFYYSGERFLYLPSAGIALLVSLIIKDVYSSQRMLGKIMLLLLLLIYGFSFYQRQYRWRQVAKINENVIGRLDSQTSGLPAEANIYLENVPGTLYGIPFLSYYTFNDAWKYSFKKSKKTFFFEPAPPPGKVQAVFTFSRTELNFIKNNEVNP